MRKFLWANTKGDLLWLFFNDILDALVVGILRQHQGRNITQEVCRDAACDQSKDAYAERP